MITLMVMAVVLIVGLCVLAYTLAVYALPFLLTVEAARLAYASGSGLIGAGLVGLVAAVAAYGLLVVLFITVRPPILRLAVALVVSARRRRWLCAGPRHHARGRAVRGLAANLLHPWRRLRWRVGAGAASRNCAIDRSKRVNCMATGSIVFALQLFSKSIERCRVQECAQPD